MAANLFDDEHAARQRPDSAYALFIDPPLGRAGMTEREARASGRPALIGKRPMTAGRPGARAGETLGFMKVLVDAETKRDSRRGVLGIEGDEVIHCCST